MYAITEEPAYEYYILLNPPNTKFDRDKYVVKDTTINENNIVMLISQNAPQKDIEFLTERMFEE